jgi:hypothetical protein
MQGSKNDGMPLQVVGFVGILQGHYKNRHHYDQSGAQNMQ